MFVTLKEKLSILRPLNLLIIGLTMFIVLLKYKDEKLDWYWIKSLLLILPAIISAAAGYVVNDIYDTITDAINKPERCTVNNTISKKNAWILYWALSIVSIGISILFSFYYFLVILTVNILLYLYAFKIKGTPIIGNLLVALLSASVISCCLLLIKIETWAGYFNFMGYTIFAFFISLIREIVKDLQDIEGDIEAGYKTYPVLYGTKVSKVLIYALITIQILLGSIYSVITFGIDLYISSIIMAIITISLIFFINLLAKSKTKDDYRKCSMLLKALMLLGVINLIFV